MKIKAVEVYDYDAYDFADGVVLGETYDAKHICGNLYEVNNCTIHLVHNTCAFGLNYEIIKD